MIEIIIKLYFFFSALSASGFGAGNGFGVKSTKIALFPSTGCYSHDVMMKQVGEQLDENENNITWIQTYLYEFGFGEIPIPSNWNRISITGIDERGEYLQKNTGSLIWKQNVPYDFDRPFNIQGVLDFALMLQRHSEYCTILMDDRRYQQLRTENVSVAILDHFLQECMAGLAQLLNASVVQFSNWPISDGYVTSFNLPAVASSVAKTGTRHSSNGMTFLERCQNLLFHVAIVVTRFFQMKVVDRLFDEKGYSWIRVENIEARRPLYGSRSELLFEPIRPIDNRIKFFGAASTLPPHHYISSLRHFESLENDRQNRIDISINQFSNSSRIELCQTQHETRRKWLFDPATTSKSEIIKRRRALREKYTAIDWDRIDDEKFVLVTFGSVAQVDKMHTELMLTLLTTFERHQNLQFIWQSNMSPDEIEKIHKARIPKNVMISSWIPIKELLAHHNVEFIICHGGINTVNELALFGVPVLGVPLQGDQASNLARIVDLGSAELMTIVELNSGKLDEMIGKMIHNIGRYWSRADQLSQMLSDHRKFHRNYQKFWLNWVARNGKKIENRKMLRFKYLGDMENRFWATISIGICVLIKLASI